MKIPYRPEIDGMRAIAVTAVIIYHLKMSYGDSAVFPGGFLGVDLFFVLSGFLITKILLQELSEVGRIDFMKFYARRARRIMPPLLMVMAVSLPFAWAVLLPRELLRFGESLLATLAFVSNIFWFFSLGEYGAQSGLLQPFLHTWSLAIEEQFYMIFPIVLIVLMRVGGRRAIGVGIVALLVLSLIASQLSTQWKPDLSFFSPVSRAWELLAGSGLAYLSQHHPQVLRGGRAARIVPGVALVVLFGYFAVFDLKDWAHPGLPTVPVILASCALLWFTRPGEPVTELLSARPLVFIGKLSYSIYLWHFPIFAFGRLTSIEGVTSLDRLLWLALTLALSVAGYYLVERPFRFRIPTRAFALTMSAAVAIVVVFSSVAMFAGSLTSGRIARLDVLYGENDYDNEHLQDVSWSVLDARTPGETIGKWNAHMPSEHEKNDSWFQQADSLKVLILGNSHSKDVFNALTLNAEAFEGVEFARFGLSSAIPAQQVALLEKSPNFAAADVIAIAPQYGPNLVAKLPELIETLKALGKRVVLMGNTAEFISPSFLPLFDMQLRVAESRQGLAELNEVAYAHQDQRVGAINSELREIAEAHGALYLSRRDLICRDEDKSCALVSPDGRKTMYDYGHWTLQGARYFGQRAAEAGWFR